MKEILSCLLLFFLLTSCKKDLKGTKETISLAEADINKGIALAKRNKPLNDTLAKYRKELGVDLMLCYIIPKEKYRILGFQVLQSDTDKAQPLKIDRPFKIEKIHGIDIFFCTATDHKEKYQPIIDDETRKLIAKGYLTETGGGGCYISKSVTLVYCADNDNAYKILSSEFLYEKEMQAGNNKYFHEEDYYPKCN